MEYGVLDVISAALRRGMSMDVMRGGIMIDVALCQGPNITFDL
jgi:hypothetical protein